MDVLPISVVVVDVLTISVVVLLDVGVVVCSAGVVFSVVDAKPGMFEGIEIKMLPCLR